MRQTTPLDWFAKKYEQKLGPRFATFSRALELLLERSGSNRAIVETGCVREKNDFSAGYSSVLFGEFLERYGGHLHSVDISERNVVICRKLMRRYARFATVYQSDSIAFLRDWPRLSGDAPIDLLYLDSLDYPVYNEFPREESQQHCLGELEAALSSLSTNAIVLIDDSDLPGGGKPLLAKQRLAELGWHNEIDGYQTLWIRE